MPSSHSPLHLAVILGSTREGRFGPIIARWFATQVGTRPELAVDQIDLADLDLPPALTSSASPGLADYRARLDRADAFVVLTPEYNHGYPAALKHAIDLAHREWHAKPVAFVSYGGMSGGLRAVEQLRQVFAELHAVTIRDCVSLHQPWAQFDGDGRMKDSAAADQAAKAMLDRLVWWANALRTARAAAPYAA